MKKILAFVFALMMLPIFNTMAECSSQRTVDYTVRVISLNDNGKNIIQDKLKVDKNQYNWVCNVDTNEFNYYDFGEVKNTFDVKIGYDQPMSLSTEKIYTPYYFVNKDIPLIMDGGIHMNFNMSKDNRNDYISFSVFIPNDKPFSYTIDMELDGYNYKYAQFENIPIHMDENIIVGNIEQFGNNSNNDYVIVLSPVQATGI